MEIEKCNLEELQRQRNKLNRQIATLKKANLKDGEFLNPTCPHCNCDYDNHRVWKEKGKWFCSECSGYIEPVESGSKEHKVSMKKIFHGHRSLKC